jgi:hypothetical protein
MKYYISFVEECVMNPLYLDYIGGRIEVYESNMPFSCREIRFFTKDIKKFNRFRALWDMKDITGKQLKWIENRVGKEFCKFPTKKEKP